MMEVHRKEILKKIEDLIIHSNDFEELENRVRYFCPFEAIGMVNQEIRHAHFLSYILDPSRPHGFDEAYLRAFLDVAAENYIGDSENFRPIHIHFADLSKTRIVREKDRIDLRIELQNLKAADGLPVVLIFELKVNSGETRHQLQEYTSKMREAYSDKADLIFFYLTLDGSDPSEANRENWTPLSLASVVEKFEHLAEKSLGVESARNLVNSYLEMMKRNHIMEKNDDLQELARKIWAEHAEVLEYLRSMQPDDVSDILERIYLNHKDLIADLSDATELDFALDEDGSSRRSIILYVPSWDHLNLDEDGRRIFVLVIDRNYGDRDTVRFRWAIRAGSQEKRLAIYDRISGTKPALSKGFRQIFGKKEKLKDSGNNLELISKGVKRFVAANLPSLNSLSDV